MGTNRAKALSWWRGMTKEMRRKRAKELAPDKSFEFINSSPYWVERIWEIDLTVTSMVADLVKTVDEEFIKQAMITLEKIDGN